MQFLLKTYGMLRTALAAVAVYILNLATCLESRLRYSPEFNLAFIHIPKNGGQSIGNALSGATKLSYAPLASDLGITETAAATAAGAEFHHPRFGDIKPSHLPLNVLVMHFPQCWSVLSDSKSFALTRAPRDRFISALMQRLKEFKKTGSIRVEDPLVREEAERVCSWLDGRDVFIDLEYIHFTRQVDYVELPADKTTPPRRVVKAIFPVSEPSAVAAWIRRESGLEIDITHDHARRQPRSWARAIQPAARFAGRRLMPTRLKRALHPLWVGSGVFADAANGYARIDLGAEVEAFIERYYAADAALHVEATNLVNTTSWPS